jgi:hypothetical protein
MGRPSMPPGSRMPASIQALYGGAASQPPGSVHSQPGPTITRISGPPSVS